MGDLETQVKKWIEGSGYSLEMVVARALRRAGFAVTQADYFKDPTTGDQREIDILAFEPAPGDEAILWLQLVCECKTSTKHPWVLFSTPHDAPRSFAARVRASTTRAQQALKPVLVKRAFPKEGPFALPKNVGYSIAAGLTSHNSSRDAAYDAISAVSAATVAVIARDEAIKEATIAWPVIILRGHLFQATLSEASEVEVEQIDRGVLAWRNPVIARQSFIHVVTEEALETWASELIASWHSWSPAAAKVLDSLEEQR